MPNRSRTEIVSEILEVVNDNDAEGIGVTRATIMNKVYLNSAHLREYLIALTVHGLLSYDSQMGRYNLTEKGLQYLELCNKIGDVLK
ncbi:MAG: winged helix-turn-helix domain-containing protein [Thermoproteota archaeon]|nr:winged helix-turn-helix domain-containing protein [Thermoproteota archaeon]